MSDLLVAIFSFGAGWHARGLVDKAITRLLARLVASKVGKDRMLRGLRDLIEGFEA